VDKFLQESKQVLNPEVRKGERQGMILPNDLPRGLKLKSN
jgi:hypothetical protein